MTMRLLVPDIVSAKRLDPQELWPGEPDLRSEAQGIFGTETDAWFDMENDLLGGRKPADLIDMGNEQPVRDLLRSIKHIGIT